jgi:hypothetical protein
LSRKLYEDFKNATFYIITWFITEIIKIVSKKYAKAHKIRLNGILSFYYLYQSNGSKYNKITEVQNYLKLNFLKVFKLLDFDLIIYYRLIAKNMYIVHIYPNSFQKMHVKLASQLLNSSMSATIRICIHTG